jgi:type IV pilus assembly protein PilF
MRLIRECLAPNVRLLLLLGLVVLSGCVTTTDSSFAKEADEEKAVQNYVQLGTAYIAQGNYGRARVHLQRALEIDADSPGALAAMGLVYQSQGENKLAAEAFRRAVESDGAYTRGRVYYGAFLYGQAQYKAAREQFLEASRDTDYADRAAVFFNLGKAQEALGKGSKASRSYRRALELSRGSPRYLLAVATALVNDGKYDEAQIYYQRLLRAIRLNTKLQHSPKSLLTGLKLARHYGDKNREASLALLLRNQYPESEQLTVYRALIANEEY